MGLYRSKNITDFLYLFIDNFQNLI